MTPTHSTVVLAVTALVFSSAAAGWTQEKTPWLDEPKPPSWNTRSAAIPAAPKRQQPVDPRCRETARPAQLDEDRRVRDRGWDLIGPYQGGWGMLVIPGAAGYDGMCRPLQYQDFVFRGGVFAGTLSPRPMDSRTDGALERVSLQSAARVTGEYVRYDAKDPLCCPTRTTVVAFEMGADGVLRPTSVSTSKR
jgi:hypothetical protein